MSFNTIIITLTFAMLGLYFSLTPSNISIKDVANMTQIDIEKFELLQFNEESMMRSLSGKSARRYSTHIEISNLALNEYTKGNMEALSAKNVTYKEKRFHLRNGVEYRKNGRFSFKTERLFYDNALDFIFVPESFIIQNGLNIAKAQNMVYDRKNGTIRAEKINASFDTKGI